MSIATRRRTKPEWLRYSRVKKVVYHTTTFDEDFKIFDTSRSDLGAHFGTLEQAEYRANLIGLYDDLNVSSNVRIIPVWLNLKNPLRLKDVGSFHSDAIADQLVRKRIIPRELAKEIKREYDKCYKSRRIYDPVVRHAIEAAGYDGVVYKNETEGRGDSYIAFHPQQIKSVIGNRGTFDPNDPVMTNPRRRNPIAYHATGNVEPYDRFSVKHIGGAGGEGKQAFGWGLYFTSDTRVSDEYRLLLSRIIGATSEEMPVARMLLTARAKDPRIFAQYLDGGESFTGTIAEKIKRGKIRLEPGRVYTVDLPASSAFLQADKPAARQPAPVKKILKDAGVLRKFRANKSDFASPLSTRRDDGHGIYNFLTYALGSEKAASLALLDLGIPGMEYPVGSLSGIKSKGRNFVIWDDDVINIVKTNPRRRRQ